MSRKTNKKNKKLGRDAGKSRYTRKKIIDRQLIDMQEIESKNIRKTNKGK